MLRFADHHGGNYLSLRPIGRGCTEHNVRGRERTSAYATRAASLGLRIICLSCRVLIISQYFFFFFFIATRCTTERLSTTFIHSCLLSLTPSSTSYLLFKEVHLRRGLTDQVKMANDKWSTSFWAACTPFEIVWFISRHVYNLM